MSFWRKTADRLQQRGDGGVLVAAPSQNGGRNGHQVGDIRMSLPLRVWLRCSFSAKPSASAKRYGWRFRQYCAVRPGITGLWQVSDRNDVSYRTRVAMDCIYARRKSPWLDTRLLAATIPAVLGKRGAALRRSAFSEFSRRFRSRRTASGRRSPRWLSWILIQTARGI